MKSVEQIFIFERRMRVKHASVGIYLIKTEYGREYFSQYECGYY